MTSSLPKSHDNNPLTVQQPPTFSWSARTKGWRPTKSDVIAISWGKPAKQKGTGSRGVPHRLNTEERFAFDQARSKGFLECFGSGYRSTRRDSPLVNSWRSYCDANACVCLILHKNGHVAEGDEIVLDFSPLRREDCFESLSNEVRVWMDAYANEQHDISISQVENDDLDLDMIEEKMNMNRDNIEIPIEEDMNKNVNVGVNRDESTNEIRNDTLQSPWETKPIYQLPTYAIQWSGFSRSKAKELCVLLAEAFQTIDSNSRPSKKPAHLKPGKNRRSGGYGI